MSENTIYFHALFFEQNIKSDFQCTKCRKQVYAHKVCQIEFTVRCTNKHWTTFIETGNMLAGKIIVRKESATVVVSFQCFIVKSSKQLIHIDFHAKTLCKFFKQIDPRIQIGSTVVTMYHSDEISGWCRNKVNFFINFFQFFFQYDHRKHRSSGRYITCADRHAVCRCHTGSGISLRRTERDSCFQISRRIQQFCSFFRQHSCLFSGNKNFREYIMQGKGISLFLCLFVKYFYAFFIPVFCFAVDREHSGCLTDTKHFFTGQFPMNVSGKCRLERNIFHMFLAI